MPLNDSSTGGSVLPVDGGPAPLEGQDLQDFVQSWVAGVAGIDGTLVRPRWQPEPPNIPAAGTAWMAVGITHRTIESSYPAVVHNDGSSRLYRHEDLCILCSAFDLGYGGLADFYLDRLRDGMAISQNHEILYLNDMGFVSTGASIAVPTLMKSRWLYRADMEVTVRRRVSRDYPVRNLIAAQGVIHAPDHDPNTENWVVLHP